MGEDNGSTSHGPEPRVHTILNLLTGRLVLATFQVNLRCNSACGYYDLSRNVGRYEIIREEIREVFSRLYCDGVRFVLVQGGERIRWIE